MTTLEALKVGHEADEERAELVRAAREALPFQQAFAPMEEAAARLGLPMTGQEVHERVRGTLRRRSRLSDRGKAGVLIFALLTAILWGLAAWAWTEWMPKCVGCEAKVGFILAFVGSFLVGSIALGINGANRTVFAPTSTWTRLEHYSAPIPEAALARYAEAQQSGLFSNFHIVEATYDVITPRKRPDSWLVGRIGADAVMGDPRTDARRAYVVLAYWD